MNSLIFSPAPFLLIWFLTKFFSKIKIVLYMSPFPGEGGGGRTDTCLKNPFFLFAGAPAGVWRWGEPSTGGGVVQGRQSHRLPPHWGGVQGAKDKYSANQGRGIYLGGGKLDLFAKIPTPEYGLYQVFFSLPTASLLFESF